jgi:hypothetical protein
MARVMALTGVLPIFARVGWGRGMIWTVMEMSALPELAGVAQLRVFGDVSCGYIVNVDKTMTPAGATTSV